VLFDGRDQQQDDEPGRFSNQPAGLI